MSDEVTITLPPRAAAELLTAITNHTMYLYDNAKRLTLESSSRTSLGEVYRAGQRRRAAQRAMDAVLAACGGPTAPDAGILVAEVELTPGQVEFLDSLTPPGEPLGYWLQHVVDGALDENGYVPDEWEPAEAGSEEGS